MSAFVCAACKTVVRDLYDRFEERIEYRRVSDQGRHAVLLKRHLCRTCVQAELDLARPPSGFTQDALM